MRYIIYIYQEDNVSVINQNNNGRLVKCCSLTVFRIYNSFCHCRVHAWNEKKKKKKTRKTLRKPLTDKAYLAH